MRRLCPLLALVLACGSGYDPPAPRGQGGGVSGAGAAGAAAGLTSSGGVAEPDGGSGGAGAGPASAGAGAGAGAAAAGCELDALAELEVFSPSWDPLGYPPYAIDRCVVVYVDAGGASGALQRVDLETGERVMLDAAEHRPRRPAIAGDVVAWERDGESGQSAVRVHSPAGERTFEASGEPRATLDAVVYTRFRGQAKSDDTDVFLYRIGTEEEQVVATGPGQQRFADVSGAHVAFTDFSEDARGYFDLGSIADVRVVDRQSGEETTRALPGKQAFPLLGRDGVLVYLEWGAVHPEPKFSQFFLKAGRISAPASADFNVKGEAPVMTEVAYVRPSLHGSRIDFVDRVGSVRLYSVDVGAAAAPTPLVDLDEAKLFGSASSERATLVSTPRASSSLRLVAVAR